MNEPEVGSPRRDLTRILLSCPHAHIGDPNPRECPLHEIRKRSLRERLAWVRTLDRDVVSRILENHSWCYAKKTIARLTDQAWENSEPSRAERTSTEMR